jgi:GT2 family glycosyltransferase
MRFFGDWEGVLRFPPYDPYKLLYRHTIGLSALMRRELVRDTGGFDPAFEQFEDWELWVNALAHGWRGERVATVTLEYRRHGATKLAADRARYRATFARLRAKHAGLYGERGRLVTSGDLGPAGRAWYRLWWGRRPLPAALERAAHRLRWRA